MDELKKQLADLEDELNITIRARERAHADGDDYHENIYKSDQAKLVQDIQDIKNKMKDLEAKKANEKWHKSLTEEQIEELKSEGIEPGDEEYDRYLWDHGINPTIKDKDVSRNIKDSKKWHSKLTPEQIEELKSEGIEPGDEEYDRYLWDHGINPTEPDKGSNKPSQKADRNSMPSLEDEIKKNDKDDSKDSTKDDKKSDDIQKLRDEYDKLNDLYLDALEELEEKRQKMENGEIPYEEYQKFSLYVIDRYKYMKDLYERITNGEKAPERKTPEDKTPEDKTPEDKTPEDKTPEDKTPEDKEPVKASVEKDSLKIIYDGKNNTYTYTGVSKGQPFAFITEANKQYFKKGKNKKNLKKVFGEQGFEALFSGATKKAYKKCDPHVVLIIYQTLGLNACRNYLLELSQGQKAKKENLPFSLTYDLSGIEADEKLNVFDRARISRMTSKNKEVAEVIPKLSSKQLKANERKLIEAPQNQHEQGEMKFNDQRTEFIAGLKDYEVQPVQNKEKAKNVPEMETLIEDDKGEREE